jgi:hypothetical protein
MLPLLGSYLIIEKTIIGFLENVLISGFLVTITAMALYMIIWVTVSLLAGFIWRLVFPFCPADTLANLLVADSADSFDTRLYDSSTASEDLVRRRDSMYNEAVKLSTTSFKGTNVPFMFLSIICIQVLLMSQAVRLGIIV